MGRPWVFAADLHGRLESYRALWSFIAARRPECVLLGGDLLPRAPSPAADGFVDAVLRPAVARLVGDLGAAAPRIGLVLGNDDERRHEDAVLTGDREGLWTYLHRRWMAVGGFEIGGYNCVPPTPFSLKDWERYDVSRFVDPGCVPPEAGRLTVPVDPDELRFGTIAADLVTLTAGRDPARAVLVCHSPPHHTNLDRADLDDVRVDHVPLDVHVGSIAVRRLIESWQPHLTLHGHVHESARLTGSWQDHIGGTVCLSAAHDGPETALVVFEPFCPEAAMRTLLIPPEVL